MNLTREQKQRLSYEAAALWHDLATRSGHYTHGAMWKHLPQRLKNYWIRKARKQMEQKNGWRNVVID